MKAAQEEGAIQHYSSWKEVPEHYASKSALRSRGLTPGPLRATVYQRSSNSIINLFIIQEATPRKAASERQVAAILKARAAQIAKRTCTGCNSVMSKKADISNGLCSYCHHEIFLEKTKSLAEQRMSHWLRHKNEYLVIDVETNMFGDDGEIIEFAVVDLDETILFESFIKPVEPVSPEAYDVHGITTEMLKDSPNWVEAWAAAQSHLEGKTILIYNKAFDLGRITANCIRHGISIPHLRSECVMETSTRVMKSYSHYHDDFTWISLRDAMQAYGVIGAGAHQASADCVNVVRLIRNVVAQSKGHQI